MNSILIEVPVNNYQWISNYFKLNYGLECDILIINNDKMIIGLVCNSEQKKLIKKYVKSKF